jgi:hypothetical protein
MSETDLTLTLGWAWLSEAWQRTCRDTPCESCQLYTTVCEWIEPAPKELKKDPAKYKSFHLL